MNGGQIAALLGAIVLLLPGGCFLIVGASSSFSQSVSYRAFGVWLLIVAAGTLSLATWLFRFAFRRRTQLPGHPPQSGESDADYLRRRWPPPDTGGPAQTPPDAEP